MADYTRTKSDKLPMFGTIGIKLGNANIPNALTPTPPRLVLIQSLELQNCSLKVAGK